jgi:hypothetical protein
MTQQRIPYETVTDKASGTAIHYNERVAQSRKQLNLPSQCARKYKPLPKEPHEQNILVDECLEWVVKNKPKSINDFPLLRGYCPFRFRKLAEKNFYFAEVLDYTMAIIGRKIEGDWREEDVVSYAKAFLPQYDKNYKEDRDKLAQKVTDAIEARLAFIPKVRSRDEIEAMEKQKNGERISDQVQTQDLSGKANIST